MIPTVHNPDSSNFENAGIGFLNDTTSFITTEERNGQFTMKLTIPHTTKYAEYLKNGYQIKGKSNDEDDYQVFVINKEYKSMSTGELIIYGKSRTFKLGNRSIKRVEIISKTAQEAMNLLEKDMDRKSDVKLYSDITTTSSTYLEASKVISCVAGQSGSLLQNWGGEIKHEPFKLSLLRKRGRDNVCTVRYRKNLSGLEADFDITNLVTSITPYADVQNQEGKTERIFGDIVDSDYVSNYYGEVYSNPVQFTEEQGVTDLKSLNKIAKNYFKSINPGCDKPKINIKVEVLKLDVSDKTNKFKDFRTMNLCDSFKVFHEGFRMNVEAQIIKVEYDGLNEKVLRLTAGDAKYTFYESQKNEVQELLKNKSSKSYMSDFIDYVSSMITGNNGGHVVMWPKEEPSDILIMDTKDVKTAKQVLRINKSGIGFSSTGVNGKFESAWTLDGTFVANFIKTGTINADVFMGSFNEVGDALRLVSGALQIWNRNIRIMELTKKGLEFWRGNDPIGEIGTTGDNFSWIADVKASDRSLFIGLDGGDFIKIANDDNDGMYLPSKKYRDLSEWAAPLTLYCKKGIDFQDSTSGFSLRDGNLHVPRKLFVGGKEVTGGGQGGGGGWNGQYPPEVTSQADKFAWQLWIYLISKGYSPAAAAGILGNVQGEVGNSMNPDTEQVGGPAYGAVQWDGSAYPLVGPVTWNGREYVKTLMGAASIKDNYTTMTAQSKLIDWCMYNGQWIGAVQPTTVTGFKSESSPENAALAFELNFERPAAAHPERQGYARNWYNKFKDLKAPEVSGNFIPPISAPITVTSEWGYRTSPFPPYPTEFHNGMDFVNGNPNTPIYASMDGEVVVMGNYPDWYGLYVVIKHANGKYTGYAHNSSVRVAMGDIVTQGQQIANMGTTGPSTAEHCHFQIMNAPWPQTNDGFENPRPYIFG